MNEKRNKLILKDVLGPKGYIRGPFGSALKRGELLKEGIPVYEQQHAIENSRSFRFFINNEKFETMKRFQVRENDLIISCSGTIGCVSIIGPDDPKGIISQALLILRANTDVVLPQYLKYFFTSKEGYNAIVSRSSGSVQVNIAKREIIEQIEIDLPDIPTQKKIVGILESLDEKIRNNDLINNNLLAQAKAIFDDRIVKIDSIPDGWREGNLLDIANYQNGLAMQKFRPREGEAGLPVLKIKELRQGLCDVSSELCSPSIRPEYIIRDGDIIFSWSGSLLVDIWCGGTCGLNQHLFKVTSETYDKWFYYLWTAHHLDRFVAIAADKATTMGHIKREELAKAEVLIPSKEDYNEISSLIKPLFELMISNRIESRKLAVLRNELLPKLMSGEINVSNITI